MRALALAAALLFVIPAGCIGKGDEPAKPATANNTTGVVDPNVTVAPDGRGSISAFNETNKTETKGLGAMVHTHDFWKGKERLEDVAWINSGLIPFPLAPCKKPDNSCTVGGSTPEQDTYPMLTAIADYDLAPPPRMGMVYEGTGKVIVTLKQLSGPVGAGEPANPAGQVFFDYLAANDEPGHFRKGGELKLNAPITLDIKPTDADMPHQTKSLWLFRIYSNSAMLSFGFNITISLVRGYDVVNWPPHPDLYADKPERVVFDAPVKLASKGSADGMLFGSDAGWTSPQKVISWGTDSVDIQLTGVQFSSQLPIPPKRFVMQVRNASSPFLMANFPNWVTLTDPTSNGQSYHFTIDLTKDRGDTMDTPYAQFSRWGFRLVPEWDDTAGCLDPYLAGCQPNSWEIQYAMKILAKGHSTAEGVPAGSA